MRPKRKVLLVIMDGVGCSDKSFGNAFKLAHTENFDYLKSQGLYTTLKAHGPFVGLPSDKDIGNSEVGHNTIGAGKIYPQGASLVKSAIEKGSLYQSTVWKMLIEKLKSKKSTLHFLGLLSDGNVHSHEKHLHDMSKQAAKEGIKKIRYHLLLDGRDVAPQSAEIYVQRLESVIDELKQNSCDAQIASGGGRMQITMDRYEADWKMVEKGWQTHVLGQGAKYYDIKKAIKEYRKNHPHSTDQDLPPFVVHDKSGPIGCIKDDDAVVLFNFRGDRAIEISKAFTQKKFTHFDRHFVPKVFFAGMMEYDGDTHTPENFLVLPPPIKGTLSEYFVSLGVRQFACSETQKFGHVTYFWNGNKSGYIDPSLEEYCEIPSDLISFDQKPKMKAAEITQLTTERLEEGSSDFYRINFPNGDMVGHTGNLEASVEAMNTVDHMLGKLKNICEKTNTILIVTSDHGNCEEMFFGKEEDYPNWRTDKEKRPPTKTSHTLSSVPFIIYDPQDSTWKIRKKESETFSLGNIANTILDLMGIKTKDSFLPSMITKTK